MGFLRDVSFFHMYICISYKICRISYISYKNPERSYISYRNLQISYISYTTLGAFL